MFRQRDPQPRPLMVAIHRLDLLLDDPATDAWDLVDEQTFPPLTRTVWHANGLRPGMLAGRDLDRFANALPGLIRVSRSQLAPGGHHSVLLTAPNQPDSIIVDLTIPPRTVREMTIHRGRIQLLARFEALSPEGNADAGVRVELTPHQYLPQITLTPRDPLEQRLDGRVFTELTLRADVPASRMLVIGLYRPPPPPPDRQPEPPADHPPHDPADDEAVRISAAPDPEALDPPDAEGDDPADEDAEPGQPARPPLPPTLGRALLTGQRMNRQVQTLLLISAEPAPEPIASEK